MNRSAPVRARLFDILVVRLDDDLLDRLVLEPQRSGSGSSVSGLALNPAGTASWVFSVSQRTKGMSARCPRPDRRSYPSWT